MPKLSRILEGKENKATRNKQGSTISSIQGHKSSRSSHHSVDAVASKNRPARQSHTSLQRVERNLASLQNPSLISVLSGLTQQSNASNESNSTITQQSYDKKLIAKRKPTKGRKRLQARRIPSTRESATMASPQPSVFQFMEHATAPELFVDGNLHAGPSSSSSSPSVSSSDSEHKDCSSTAEQPTVESPPTSHASTRRLNLDDSYEEEEEEDDDTDSDDAPEAPTQHVYQPSVTEAIDENDGQGDGAEDGSESDEEQEPKHDGNVSSAGMQTRRPSYADRMALERIPPPRVPSPSSSRHSDRHMRRLKRQEQALQEHILQNPQPHREFHFTGATSPHHPPTMPLYPSPASFARAAHHVPPAAPTQAIGYYSPAQVPSALMSPGYDNEFAIAARPPMVPSVVAQSCRPPYSTMQPPNYQVRPSGPDLSKTTIVGYELLADKLSNTSRDCRGGQREEAEGKGEEEEEKEEEEEESVFPMYRRFEKLNHRVLLHLQDEIAELEEELRHVDECIAQCSPKDHAGHHHPASRRGDARYGGELHHGRTELLGRIYLKLGQYNSALTSFNTMVKSLDAAKTDHVQAYRSWMEKRRPIDSRETRFLEHDNDLLRVAERRSASAVGGAGLGQSGATWLPLVLVLPLMMFAIVPGLVGRLVMVGLTGAATMQLMVSCKEVRETMAPREWVGCFSVYFGFMALLAALAH